MTTSRKTTSIEIDHYGPLAGPGWSSVTLLGTAAASLWAVVGALGTVAVALFLCVRLLPMAFCAVRDMAAYVVTTLFTELFDAPQRLAASPTSPDHVQHQP